MVCKTEEGVKMKKYKGSIGTPMQTFRVRSSKRKSKLTELEKLKRGIGCAKGSELKCYPNDINHDDGDK